jgi:hypothetical protein
MHNEHLQKNGGGVPLRFFADHSVASVASAGIPVSLGICRVLVARVPRGCTGTVTRRCQTC